MAIARLIKPACLQTDICKRIGNVFPCEVKDLLLAMVTEGVLRSRCVALCAQ
eukprot:COSAG01_NODE_3510_length_5981_cov_2.840183_1_plen_51_part_10